MPSGIITLATSTISASGHEPGVVQEDDARHDRVRLATTRACSWSAPAAGWRARTGSPRRSAAPTCAGSRSRAGTRGRSPQRGQWPGCAGAAGRAQQPAARGTTTRPARGGERVRAHAPGPAHGAGADPRDALPHLARDRTCWRSTAAAAPAPPTANMPAPGITVASSRDLGQRDQDAEQQHLVHRPRPHAVVQRMSVADPRAAPAARRTAISTASSQRDVARPARPPRRTRRSPR